MNVIVKQSESYYLGHLYYDEEEQTAILMHNSQSLALPAEDQFSAIDYLESEHDLEIYSEEDFEIFNTPLAKYGKQVEDLDFDELVDLLNDEGQEPDLVIDLTVCRDTKGDKEYKDYKMTIREEVAEQLESHWYEMLIREEEKEIYLYRREQIQLDEEDSYPRSSIYDNVSRNKQVSLRCTIKKSVIGNRCWIARVERQMLYKILHNQSVLYPSLNDQ